MSPKPALTTSPGERRLAALAVSLPSLAILGLNYMSWSFAPRWGPAAVIHTSEVEATNALMEAASHNAAMLATSITAVAAIVVLIAMVLLMIWPIRRGYLIVAAITPVALVAIWVATRADLSILKAWS
jgi:hypothetical protein